MSPPEYKRPAFVFSAEGQNQVLEDGRGGQIIVINCGDYKRALALGAHVLKNSEASNEPE